MSRVDTIDSVTAEQSAWWHVRAEFQTTDGELGTWSGNIEVKPGENHVEVAESIVRKLNHVERALDMNMVPYLKYRIPYHSEEQ